MTTKNILVSVSAILAAAMVLLWVTEHQSQIKLGEENQALRQQVEELAARNERLSNAMAQADSSQSLTKEQFGELLRLRGEAGRLRQENEELAKLREQNQQLRAALSASQSFRTSKPTPEALDYWPKDSWAFAGYATPESTLKSLLWSASKGDMKGFLASTTGEFQKRFEDDDLKQKSEAELAAEMVRETANFSSCHLLGKEYLPDDEVQLTLWMDGHKTETNKFILKKVGNEWKLGGEE